MSEAIEAFGDADAATLDAGGANDHAAPDLGEQEAALAAKLGGPGVLQAGDEQLEGDEYYYDDEAELDDDERYADEDDEYDDYDEDADAEQGLYEQPPEVAIDPTDPVMNHPGVQALVGQHDAFIEQHNVVVAYLQQQEQERTRAELNSFAEQNPDIMKPEILEQVATRVRAFAERAGDDSVRTDPRVVEMAYKSTLADRAAEARSKGRPAAPSGAPLETQAGASGPSGGESYKDAMWSEIQNAGGSAFPV